MKSKRGFSLVELLVVIGVILVLAAILFPVFAAVKNKAKHVAWAESVRQVSIGNIIYMGDYDDAYPPARYSASRTVQPIHDRTWVQVLLPYVRSFDLFICPVDTTREPSVSLFDPDLTGTDTYAKYHLASMRANIGYNFTYLAPMVYQNNWRSISRYGSEIENPSETLQYADSAWEIVNGKPKGGGNYLVLPPCRFHMVNGSLVDTFGLNQVSNANIYTGGLAWTDLKPYPLTGGVYPWFKETVTIATAAGNIKRVKMESLTAGCEVKPNWQGYVFDLSLYIWDLD